jgi:hypothetical protein
MLTRFGFRTLLLDDAPADGGGGKPAETVATLEAKPPDVSQERTFTQSELNDLIGKTRAEERKKAKQEADDEARKAAMTEAERLKSEKDAAVKTAADAETRANARVIKSELKVALAQANLKPERMDYALRLIDLESVGVEDGEPDAKAIQAVVKKIQSDVPELFAVPGTSKAGSEDFSKRQTGEPPITSREQIQNMDIAEKKKRQPEIDAYYISLKK